MKQKILVTGATGSVGSEVFDLLRNEGQWVAGTTRSARRAATLRKSRGGEWVPLDFTDPATFGAAFDGVDRMFLMRPPAVSNVKRDLAPAVEAARQAGVSHVVFLSLQGVERNRFVPHRAVEDLLMGSGIRWTMLRPSFFMQNLSTTHRDEIRLRSEIFVPAGRGRTSFIDVRDIAAVAVKALTEDCHFGKGYELTSNDALTYYEIADILSRELGRTITYRNPGPLRFILRKLTEGTPLGMVMIMTALYTVARLGKAGKLSDTTGRLLARPPISFARFAHDYRAVWE